MLLLVIFMIVLTLFTNLSDSIAGLPSSGRRSDLTTYTASSVLHLPFFGFTTTFPRTDKAYWLGPQSLQLVGWRLMLSAACWYTCSGITVMSAPVSMLNSTGWSFIITFTVQSGVSWYVGIHDSYERLCSII